MHRVLTQIRVSKKIRAVVCACKTFIHWKSSQRRSIGTRARPLPMSGYCQHRAETCKGCRPRHYHVYLVHFSYSIIFKKWNDLQRHLDGQKFAVRISSCWTYYLPFILSAPPPSSHGSVFPSRQYNQVFITVLSKTTT